MLKFAHHFLQLAHPFYFLIFFYQLITFFSCNYPSPSLFVIVLLLLFFCIYGIGKVIVSQPWMKSPIQRESNRASKSNPKMFPSHSIVFMSSRMFSCPPQICASISNNKSSPPPPTSPAPPSPPSSTSYSAASTLGQFLGLVARCHPRERGRRRARADQPQETGI